MPVCARLCQTTALSEEARGFGGGEGGVGGEGVYEPGAPTPPTSSLSLSLSFNGVLSNRLNRQGPLVDELVDGERCGDHLVRHACGLQRSGRHEVAGIDKVGRDAAVWWMERETESV